MDSLWMWMFGPVDNGDFTMEMSHAAMQTKMFLSVNMCTVCVCQDNNYKLLCNVLSLTRNLFLETLVQTY